MCVLVGCACDCVSMYLCVCVVCVYMSVFLSICVHFHVVYLHEYLCAFACGVCVYLCAVVHICICVRVVSEGSRGATRHLPGEGGDGAEGLPSPPPLGALGTPSAQVLRPHGSHVDWPGRRDGRDPEHGPQWGQGVLGQGGWLGSELAPLLAGCLPWGSQPATLGPDPTS